MKKQLLTSFFGFVLSLGALAQCDPFEHDWGTATYGVSPNAAQGENFEPAILNVEYADQVYVKCPSSIQDVDPTIIFNVPIDSISLDSIVIFNGLTNVSLNTIGLYVSCNNNGDSPNPCMFYPTHVYCGDIYGTPTVAGQFPATIYVTAYFQAFGNQAVPYPFEGYTIEVTDPTSVAETPKAQFSLDQNSPNPANTFTQINYELSSAQSASLEIVSLVGQVVMNKTLTGKRGFNTVRVDTSELESGVYLYSIRSGDKKITKRLIVQH